MNDDELWSVYQRVVFKLIDSLPQAARFMIITSDYPQGRALGETLRRRHEQQLYEALMHYSRPCRLYGCSADLKHRELSFAVAAIPLSDALKIARVYKQNAIYEVRNDHLYLHPCLITSKTKVAVDAFSERIV